MKKIITTIKSILPQSLLWRSLLILVAPLLLVQIISLSVFYATHWSVVSRRLAINLASEISAVVDLLQESKTSPITDDPTLILVKQQLGLDIFYSPGGILTQIQQTRPTESTQEELWIALRERTAKPQWIETSFFSPNIIVTLQLAEGTLSISVPRKRLYSTTTYVFMIWTVGTSLLMLGIATIFMRNQIRSVRRLAVAMDRFGKGRDIPDFHPEGATEVRQAAAAFNRMRKRITRQIQQRTEMLAGVSHDLRTPLTRMKLQLAFMESVEGAQELQADITEMQQMIEGYLTFARGEGGEAVVLTALNPLIERVINRFRRENHHQITGILGPEVILPLRPQAIARVISNLLSNALRYAQIVSCHTILNQNQSVVILFDDDGPGIPPQQRAKVFKAFHRLDQSRNSTTGGVGLGLTISRDIIHSHGGDILLETSPLGGLRVRVTLPL